MGQSDHSEPDPRDGVRPLPRLVEPRESLRIASHAPGAPDRARPENFIRAVFHAAYGARIRNFYPHLLSVTRPDGGYAAVAGIRAAAWETLFAECYLDAPVEDLIARHTEQPITRAGIVEIGNLAPANAGQARWLIAAMTACLHAAGFTRVVFTGVPALCNAFRRMGLPLTELATADPQQLPPASQDDWGRYYQAGPKVYTGRIATGYQHISAMLRPDMPRLWLLWHAARQEGARLGAQLGHGFAEAG